MYIGGRRMEGSEYSGSGVLRWKTREIRFSKLNCVERMNYSNRPLQRDISKGQSLAGFILVFAGTIAWLLSGLALISGIWALIGSLTYQELQHPHQYFFILVATTVGLVLMPFSSLVMQAGSWMRGKEVWGRQPNPLQIAFRIAIGQTVAVVGLLLFLAGLVWFLSLFFYNDWAPLPFSLAITFTGFCLMALLGYKSMRTR